MSPATSPLPKEFSSILNPPLNFNCISAAARATMIDSLATQTRMGPVIVPTANLMVDTACFSAMELPRGSHIPKIPSTFQPLKPKTSLVQKAPVKRTGYSCSTEMYATSVTREESTPWYTQLEVSLLSNPLSCLIIGLDIGLIDGQIAGSLRSFTQVQKVITIESK